MKLSIIVPAYNEEENIEDTIEKIEAALNFTFTLIVVNDHSKDNTASITRRLSAKYNNIRLVENTSEKGFANALKTGFKCADEGVVIPVMADLCDDLNSIKTMLAKINAGYDLVCANRYAKGAGRFGGSKLKGALSRFAGSSLHLLLRLPTHDAANAFKMYRKNVLDNLELKSKWFEVSMECLLKSYYLGFKITEVPSIWKERTKGKSSFKIMKVIPGYLKLYIWAIFKKIWR